MPTRQYTNTGRARTLPRYRDTPPFYGGLESGEEARAHNMTINSARVRVPSATTVDNRYTQNVNASPIEAIPCCTRTPVKTEFFQTVAMTDAPIKPARSKTAKPVAAIPRADIVNLSVRQRRRRDIPFPWQRDTCVSDDRRHDQSHAPVGHSRSQSVDGGAAWRMREEPIAQIRPIGMSSDVRVRSRIGDRRNACRVTDEVSPEQTAFDEAAYLQGNVNFVSHCVNKPRTQEFHAHEKNDNERPEWVKKAKDAHTQFDENKFLRRRSNVIFRSSSALDKNRVRERRAACLEEAAREERLRNDRLRQEKVMQDAHAKQFADESGKISMGQSGEEDTLVQMKEGVRLLRRYSASLQTNNNAPNTEDDNVDPPFSAAHCEHSQGENAHSAVGFDEEAYLAGKVNVVVGDSHPCDISMHPGGFDKIPSKVFNKLRRSVSNDPCSGQIPIEGVVCETPATSHVHNSDPNVVYHEMMYVGRQIPSRAFSRLRHLVNKTNSSDAELHSTDGPCVEERPPVAMNAVDADVATDTVAVEPGKCSGNLRESLANCVIKVG